MPRTSRQLSESGYYHVILRGIGRQLLFEDTEERLAFLNIVTHYRDLMGFSVIAWCLMDNHIHLLIHDANSNLSDSMKRISVTFAQRHNKKADHVGHVFQDRFKSVPIESDEQLLACMRYIHDNPAKAGICAASEYPWSSYQEYVGVPRVADTKMLLDMLGGTEGFVRFSQSSEVAYDVAPDEKFRLTDAEARRLMHEILGEEGVAALEHGTKKTRNAALRELKDAGLSVRQIERLTGVGRGIIQRA